jgi:hypothetical protein
MADLADDAFIEELRRGLEGVSDGPWEANQSPDRHHTDVVYGRYLSGAPNDVCLVGASELDEQNANSAHIARCSPDRILALLDRTRGVLADLASAARSACDARQHTDLIEALVEADRLIRALEASQ